MGIHPPPWWGRPWWERRRLIPRLLHTHTHFNLNKTCVCVFVYLITVQLQVEVPLVCVQADVAFLLHVAVAHGVVRDGICGVKRNRSRLFKTPLGNVRRYAREGMLFKRRNVNFIDRLRVSAWCFAASTISDLSNPQKSNFYSPIKDF